MVVLRLAQLYLPAAGRLLGEEYLGAAEVFDVNQRHTAGAHLDGFQHAERCLVAST